MTYKPSKLGQTDRKMTYKPNKLGQTDRKMTYKPNKLGQTDLVLGLWSEFISRSVHAELYTSLHVVVMTCATYTDKKLLTGYTISSASWGKKHKNVSLQQQIVVHL